MRQQSIHRRIAIVLLVCMGLLGGYPAMGVTDMKQTPLWDKERSQLGLPVPERAWDWLSRPYKLSVAFKRVVSTLKVDVISQCFEPVLKDEAA